MARKWIINDGDLIIGDVEMHDEKRDRNKTLGGGYWYFDRSKNVIFFWGKSIDFGQVSKDVFDAAFKQPSVEQAKLFFSLNDSFENVIGEYEKSCNNSE